ncbi:hypothetical protein N5C16_03200 [Stenotrophomonas sp. GD03908]|uniref:DUF2384 domain-containing protein n=1 Tax=Stenotrophomonas maltophilia TaxID=40324 RepID=A0AAJ2TLJ3_STEMA|nr:MULTISPECIES: hypothetical protein [Stenotrophomonas]MBH1481066.1 hypothetical protein [Stenotrophomonas maltophilia]MDH0978271.1 hypothetical protein [Stenotrophomonas sp. GD03908]MDQ7292990.1 hypothetical protein [Stenotrophomonas sp. Sm0041]MDZ5765379.1 hypothetical protein [Stenotrophomonas maltophilia]
MHFDTLTPAQRIRRDAATARQTLAAQWPSAAQVGHMLDSHAPNGSELVGQLRRAGKLLGVYVTQSSPGYRYPTWQFHANGQPVAHLAEILEVLREFGPFEHESGGLGRTTGWGEVEWFLTPHAMLDGATPAEMLATDPCRILRAACVEFHSETE